MFTKIYESIKKDIQENYIHYLFLLVILTVLSYKLPYYIQVSGGLIDINKRVVVENSNDINGSYNMCYVKEIRATTFSYLIALFNDDWELDKIEDYAYNKTETTKDINKRGKIYLDSSNQNAIINAFKYANKDYLIKESNFIVLSKSDLSDTDLEIGDEILEIDGNSIKSKEDLSKYLSSYEPGDKISVKVVNDDKYYDRYAVLYGDDNYIYIGVYIDTKYVIETNPKVSFKFKRSESGSSGGLMLGLALYDYLTEEDMTRGLKIAGTGILNEDGTIESIGGVKYKLKGAVKSKADIFFVPNGENYEEAMKEVNRKKYNIIVYGVSTFEEALNYLKEYNK